MKRKFVIEGGADEGAVDTDVENGNAQSSAETFDGHFSLLLDLPRDVLKYLLVFLPHRDFFNLDLVCHDLNALSKTEDCLVARYRHPKTKKPEMLSRMIASQAPNIKAMGLKIFKAEYAGLIDKLVDESKREQQALSNSDDFCIMDGLVEGRAPLTEGEFEKLTQLGQLMLLMLGADPIGVCMAHILICVQKGKYSFDAFRDAGRLLDELVLNGILGREFVAEKFIGLAPKSHEEYIRAMKEIMPSRYLLGRLLSHYELDFVNGGKTLAFFESLGLVDFVLTTSAHFSRLFGRETEVSDGNHVENKLDLFSMAGVRDFVSDVHQKTNAREAGQLDIDENLRFFRLCLSLLKFGQKIADVSAHMKSDDKSKLVGERRQERSDVHVSERLEKILRDETLPKARQEASSLFSKLEKNFDAKFGANKAIALTPAFFEKRGLGQNGFSDEGANNAEEGEKVKRAYLK